MISYLYHVLEMAKNGNDLIQSSLKECIELVNNKQTCWLTSVIYLLRLSGDDTNFMQADSKMTNNLITKLNDKLKQLFIQYFFHGIGNSSKLSLYYDIKKEFRLEQYLREVKYFKYGSALTKIRISAHNFPIESGRWKAIPKQNRICLLCMNNSIGDERHYLFHCTNGDLVDIRINFMKEFYKHNEIIDSGPLDTNNIIIKLLRGEYKIDYANIGKFLAHILEVSSELLRQTKIEQSG